MVDVLLLGATGYTGRLIARYLATHPQRGSFTFGLAARSDSKLKALVHENCDLLIDVPLFVVDVTSSDAVDKAVQQTRVVINTVGPYWRWGTPVVQACVRNGRHYVDLTGETHWVKDMILRQFDYAATKARSVIVPCAGLDSIPSDILAYLGNKTLKAFAGPSANVDMSTSAWTMDASGLSGGTFSSILSYIEEVPGDKVKASQQDFALSPVRGTPSPRLRVFYSLPVSNPPVQGALYLMAFIDLQIVQRSWGLFELAKRNPNIVFGSTSQPRGEHKNPSDLSYGSQFKYEEFSALPSRFHSLLEIILLVTVAFALKVFPPVSARWLARRLMPRPGEGPTDEQLEQGTVNITNITTSTPDARGRTVSVRSIFRGKGEPGYLLRSIMIAECALSLILDSADLPAFANRGGVLTPMTAFGDVLIERLKACSSISIESEVLAAGDGGRRAL
ncbi:hypothetical protein HYDPIDRAFT_108169 [Hydnomerulius pinastri MD-312]|nr:hypothetical protein HYDPIDRAFT_108169 [Hydnomerulius pinastri MD-312]